MKFFDRVLNPREIRRRLGMNQEQFWTQIGVTQSGGSRYESGREMPRPVKELLRLVHVEQIDLSQVKRVDFEIISYLKEAHPDLYRSLRRAARISRAFSTAARIAACSCWVDKSAASKLCGFGLRLRFGILWFPACASAMIQEVGATP